VRRSLEVPVTRTSRWRPRPSPCSALWFVLRAPSLPPSPTGWDKVAKIDLKPLRGR